METHLLILAVAAAATVALLSFTTVRTILANDITVGDRVAALAERSRPRPMADARSLPIRLFGSLTGTLNRWFGEESARLRLERAGMQMTVGQFLVLRLALMAFGGIGGTVAGMAMGTSPVLWAVLGALTGTMLPLLVLKVKTVRRQRRTESQLSELCDVMSSMLTAGFGYMQALREASAQVNGPLGYEVGRFLDAVAFGADFEDALGELRERLKSDDFEVVATALEVQRRTGGNLAEILQGVSETIRDRQAFHQELRTLTSRERFSAIIVAAFPIVLAVSLAALMPDVFGRLFTDPVGQIVLGIALGLDLLGYIVARRVASLEV